MLFKKKEKLIGFFMYTKHAFGAPQHKDDKRSLTLSYKKDFGA